MQKLIFGLAAVLLFGNADAQTPDPCASQSNTIEINECAQRVLRQKDDELNRAYQELIRSLSPRTPGDSADDTAVKRELAEAQRAWVKFRDSDCKAKYKFWEQGSIRGVMHLGCLIERTEQRTKELRNWTQM